MYEKVTGTRDTYFTIVTCLMNITLRFYSFFIFLLILTRIKYFNKKSNISKSEPRAEVRKKCPWTFSALLHYFLNFHFNINLSLQLQLLPFSVPPFFRSPVYFFETLIIYQFYLPHQKLICPTMQRRGEIPTKK